MSLPVSMLIVTLGLAPSPPAPTAPAAAELTALLNEFLAGASRSDAAIHDRFWAEDLIYTRSAGKRIGKADILRDLRAAPGPKPGDPTTSYTAEDVRIQQYGSTAVVAFRLVGITRRNGTEEVARYLNTGTFLKRAGRWQAVAWQATRMPGSEEEAKQAAAAVPTYSNPQGTIERSNHVPIQDLYAVIVTDKRAECRDFYTRWFGFKVAFEASWFVYLAAGGERPFGLAFMTPDHPSRPPGPEAFNGKGMFLTLQVEDAAAEYERLRRAGVAMAYPLHDEPWGQRRFAVYDPSGTWVDVVQQIEPAAGFWDKYRVDLH